MGREIQINVPFKVEDRFLVEQNGKRHPIKELTLKIRIRISFLDARQSDYFYNKTQVVLASVDDPGSDNELSVAIVQFPPSFSDRFKLAYKLITPKQSG